MTRPIRDILAECMRRERVGLIRPLWEDWKDWGDDECEHVRKRADFLIRLLEDEFGVKLVKVREPTADVAPSPEIYRYPIVGRNKAQRVIRRASEGMWEVVVVEDDQSEQIESRFSLVEALRNGGMVLTGDPEAAKIPGLGRQLAALSEICRVTTVTREQP